MASELKQYTRLTSYIFANSIMKINVRKLSVRLCKYILIMCQYTVGVIWDRMIVNTIIWYDKYLLDALAHLWDNAICLRWALDSIRCY